MINLKISTEYNFGVTYGRIQTIIDNCKEKAIAITDPNTFGHVKFYSLCKKAGIKPLLGLKVSVVGDTSAMERQPTKEIIILAKNNNGLKELYRLNTLANKKFYYIPRLEFNDFCPDEYPYLSNDIFVIGDMPGHILEKNNESAFAALNISKRQEENFKIIDKYGEDNVVVLGDNYYPTVDDLEAYQLMHKHHEDKSTPMHIIGESEARGLMPILSEIPFKNAERIASECDVTLPTSGLPVFDTDKDIMQICLEGADKRGLDLTDEYMERLEYEIGLIYKKKYEDYFYIISDLVIYAKKHMLVGPSRGSSAGSLVCYLMFITDIDPIAHGLIFERFIDLNREDLPDIDIDFQDTKRYMVFDYLKEKYGQKNVGIIGTILTLQNRSALSKVAQGLEIPEWEILELKDAIEKRSAGDARAEESIRDTFDNVDIGKKTIEKHPSMVYAADIEGHASHFGKHAAGIVLSKLPIEDYCSQTREGVCQLDKKDAEKINLLKIDVLGLRTLSVIQDCLDMAGKDREWLLALKLEDHKAFGILNQNKFAGIFQFEGQALQSLCKKMTVESFNDIVILTSIARPGPLQSGGAEDFIKVRTGKKEVYYLDRLAEKSTEETLGCIVYQEQVMNIMRSIGGLSWSDVSEVRKAMAKSLGDEYLSKYLEKFLEGAKNNGLEEERAVKIWDSIASFAQYAFNKSHAVSYGLISYWCMVLKAYFPLEFYCSCLKYSNSDEQSIFLLREFVRRGGQFIPFDKDKSEINWSIKDGKLIGGFTNLKGIGEKKAIAFTSKIHSGGKLTPGQMKVLENKKTPFDNIFECEEKFSDIYDNPKKHKVVSGKVMRIEEIQNKGSYVFIGKITKKTLRDVNEAKSLQKRKGERKTGQTQWLRLDLEDDTGQIMAGINRYDFIELGKPLLDMDDQWIIWKGTIKADFRYINISKWRLL